MNVYVILPLSNDVEVLSKFKERIAGLKLENAFEPQYDTGQNKFVLFNGTPTELSHAIVKAGGNDQTYIPHLIVRVNWENVAGQGPTDLIQWFQTYVK